MPNKKINQLDSRVISSTDLILVGDPSTGVSFKSLVSGLGLIYVPNSRTLNINGTTYDLSSNRSWSVGTVTSVNLIAGTGVSVSGGPITNSGSINIVNTAPDQVVALTGAGTAVITGTYPNFTITSNDEFDGTVTSVNLTAGTGISVSGGPITGSGSISVTNTAPDQVVSLTGAGTTTISGTYPNFTITSTDSNVGTVTSVDMTVPTGLSISGNPITSAGTLALALASGYSIPTTASQANWNTAYNDSITSASVSGTSTKTLTLNQQDGGTVTASWSDIDTGLTSVGLSMPSAFAVANSPLTSNGTIAVTGAGTSAQYVRGDGQLANFPTNGGGGSSVNYYLNGSVSQGTFGGVTYYEMSKTPIIGAGTNFTRTNAQGNGYIASFITDANDPALLNIPGGNWNIEFYFQASSGGGNPSFYAELYKVSSANVFTLIASGSTNPEGITQGTVVDQYFTSIPVPQTALLATDRIAVRIFVTPSGRNITLHTEDNNLCEVLTTFSTGLNALNGLTAQVQYFATSTIGTDFNIQSLTDTHTFNLPVASGSNTGKLSNVDWLTFDGKENVLTFSAPLSRSVNTVSIPVANTSQPGYLDSTDWTTFNAKVTSVSATSPLFSSGGKTPTLTIQQASGSQNGYLSSTDWTTFNSKQNTITLTTTGSSGASTFISNTLNVPTYTLSGLGGVPTTRTLTINGTAYDLSADRSWTIPVHDAVTIGTANGLSLSTQVLSLGLASSSANGALSSTDWSTFNGKQNAITLTTTGTSGAATLVGSTLNIPQYADQFVGTVTSVSALTIGTTGTDLSSSVANGTTTPVITLNVPTASATNRGALSSADWTTFNSKQAALNGTGFVKISGTTISYDNTSYLPLTGGTLSSASSAETLRLVNSGTGYGLYNQSDSYFQGDVKFQSVSNTILKVDSSNKLIAAVAGTDYQAPITNPVTGTGTTNYLPKWTSGSAIGNSAITDDGTTVSLVSRALSGTSATFSSNVTALGFTTGTANSTLYAPLSQASRYPTASQIYLGNPNAATDSFSGITFQVTRASGTNTNAYIGAVSTTLNPAIVFGQRDGGNNLYVERMRIDSLGNLGLGVKPSAWQSDSVVLELPLSAISSSPSSSTFTNLSHSAYFNGTNWIQKYTDVTGARYQMAGAQAGSSHAWFVAPNSTAGNAITFTQAMTLTSGGNLLVGTTIDSGERLVISGSGRFVNQLRAYNLLSDNTIKGSDHIEVSPDQGTYNAWNFRIGAQAADNCYYIKGGGVNILTTEGYNNPYTVKLYSNGVQTLTMTNGAATFSSSVTGAFFKSTNGTVETVLSYSSTPAGVVGTLTNHPLEIYTNGGVKATITSGGNLLVGSSVDSGEKLQIRTGDFILYGNNTTSKIKIYNNYSSDAVGVSLFNTSGTEVLSLNGNVGNITMDGSIRTGTPTGGTARPWKLGQYNATAPTATGYVEVEINGVLYKLIAAT